MSLLRFTNTRSRRTLRTEPLEARHLLAANPIITEFMASNFRTLIDPGEVSSDPIVPDSVDESYDWIEIYNDGDRAVDLADRYYLTNNPQSLTQWRFPDAEASELGPKEYLVVRASGLDKVDADGRVHTSFRLRRSGDYLALVHHKDDGDPAVVSQFGSSENSYPDQRGDIAFGLPFENIDLFAREDTVDVLIPNADDDARLGNSWTGGDEVAFDAAGGLDGWSRGTNGVGHQIQDAVAQYRQDVISESSLISYYTFENDSEGNRGVQDVAGKRTRPGTLQGTATFGPGVNGDAGKALTLDGSGFVSLGPVPELSFRDGSATFEAWLRPTFSERGEPVSWYGTRTQPRGEPAHEHHSLQIHGDYSGIASVSRNDSGQIAPVQLALDEWIHVAVVYGDGLTRIYVNGELINDVGFGTFGGVIARSQTQIGTSAFAIEGDHFVGQIDEFAIYEDPLSAETILRHYENFAFSQNGLFLGTDVQTEMLEQNASAYLRGEFMLDDPAQISGLTLNMRYNDGFAAYLNGQFMLQKNAPQQLDYRATATANHDVLLEERFDVGNFASALQTGKNVLAIHGLNAEASEEGFLIHPILVGHRIDGTAGQYLLNPTPGGPNQGGVPGFVSKPTIDVPHGFYDEGFDVTLTSTAPGASLVYTTDGTPPSSADGVVISSTTPDEFVQVTLHVDSPSTVLRARSLQDGLGPSPIETQTYLIVQDLEDVAQLGEMDLNAVFDLDERSGLIEQLKALPTISIATDEMDYFGPGGVYYGSSFSGRDTEVPISFEVFDPKTGNSTRADGGLRTVGGGSRIFDKVGMRVYMRGAYGQTEFQYPFFDPAESPIDTFDSITLRSGAHDSWTSSSSPSQQYIKDLFWRETKRDMGRLSARGTFAHLFINGKYWGVYMPTERPTPQFAADHVGGDPEGWSVLHASVIESGSPDVWNAATALVNGPADDAAWEAIQKLIDIDNFIDEVIVRTFHEVGDWRGEANLYAISNPQFGGFQFLTWDTEITIEKEPSSWDVTVVGNSPGEVGGLFWWLLKHPEYQLRFADRAYKHLFNDGALTPEQLNARWQPLADLVRGPLALEAARWRGDRTDMNLLGHLEEGHHYVTETWFPERNESIIPRYANLAKFPEVTPPSYQVNGVALHGGTVWRGDQVSISPPEESTVYYTIDGTDPRLEGGAISPTAQQYTPGNSFPITRDIVAKARALRGEEWSVLSEAEFSLVLQPAGSSNLRIAEIQYNPSESTDSEAAAGHNNNDDFEFIEVVNISHESIDLSDVRLVRELVGDREEGVEFRFSHGPVSRLGSGQRVVIAENSDAFQARYGDALLLAGQWSGGLSNGGEQVKLVVGNQVIHQFSYDDGWHPSTDGVGSSLEIIDATGDVATWGQQGSWRPSVDENGSPGRESPRGNYDADAGLDADDIDILYGNVNSQGNNPAFDLTADGNVDTADVDELIINILDSRYGDLDLDGNVNYTDFQTFAVSFGMTEAGWADGDLDGDGTVSFRDFTLLAMNFGPRNDEPLDQHQLEAAETLVISEIMPVNDRVMRDHDGDTSDWLEIHNPTDLPISLGGWHVTDDQDELDKWTFPNVTIPGGEFVVIFASGKDLLDLTGELHTNFRLRAEGEYLALVRPDLTIAHQFSPTYPPQSADVSYGLASETTLLLGDGPLSYYVPSIRDRGLTTDWAQPESDDTAWTTVEGGSLARGVGFALDGAPAALSTLFETDLAGKARNTTLLLREEFTFDASTSPDSLVLRMQYDDGFVAYLNGTPVIRANAPETLDWNSSTNLEHSTHETVLVEDFDLSEHIPSLRDGTNLLAVHHLNVDIRDEDLLLRAELVAFKSNISDQAARQLATSTPHGINRGIRSPLVTFSQPSGVLDGPLKLSLATAPGWTIHYTTNGGRPSPQARVYTEPITVSETTLVQAISVAPGTPTGEVTRRWYTMVDSSLNDFTSDIPIIVLDNFGGETTSATSSQFSALQIFEPNQSTGRTSLLDAPTHHADAGLKKRGNSTAKRIKPSLAVEIWDDRNDDTEMSLFGLPASSDWILLGPFEFDRALIRNTFINEISNQIGRYAPRTRFVEVYQNVDGGNLSADDYIGVYVFMEKIKRGPGRVDVERLTPQNNAEPEIAGGWILKRDFLGPDEFGLTLNSGLRITHVYPQESNVTPTQEDWIREYFEKMEQSLSNPDPETGYPHYIDVGSWVDHHLMRVLIKEADSLVVSTFFYKSRDGKLVFGPIWDNDKSAGADDWHFSVDPRGWHLNDDHFWNQPWWNTLFQNADFNQAWVDRWFELRKSAFATENIFRVVDDQAAELRESQERNFERWPTVVGKKGNPEFEFSLPDQEGWEGEITHYKGYLATRVEWIDSRLVAPPSITALNDGVAGKRQVQLSADAPAIYYTTDGSDPRAQGGGVQPNAIRLLLENGDVTIEIPVGAMITARAMDNPAFQTGDKERSPWSGLVSQTLVDSPVRGDFDGDLSPDVDDIELLYAHIHAGGRDASFDLNGDDLVNQTDVDEMVLNILSTQYGDNNLDGRVDQTDFGVLASNFGKETNVSWGDGDFNGDGVVSFSDFTLLSNHFGFGDQP